MKSQVIALRGQNTMPLQAMLDRPVAYHCTFVKLGVGVTGALMLSQAVYWSSRTNDSEGWFYKSQVDWEAETGLTRYEQEGARKKLVKLGLIEECKRGVPCKLFFRVCLDVISASLVAENQHSSMRKTSKLECGKPASRSAENPQSITENTTEITSVSAQGAHVEDIFAASEYRPMTLGWKPESKALKAYSATQGVNLSQITDDLIATFTCHHSAHPETHDTAAGWANRLVKWAKAERVRSEAVAGQAAVLADEGSCPVDKIIDLYHRTCPSLPPVSVAADKTLRSMIVERWNEAPEHQSGQLFWLPFFLKANNRNQVFFRGQNAAPRLESLVSRSVFREIAEAAQ